MFFKTNTLKKMVFIPVVGISALMTSLLFFQFGSNYFTAALFVVVGLSIQGYQIISLLEWKNSIMRKRLFFGSLTKYLIITLTSCIASIAFGVKEIDHKITIMDVSNVEIVSIERVIENRKSLLGRNRENDIIYNQINILQSQIPRLKYNISERSKILNDEINKLKLTIVDDRFILSEISKMEKKAAILKSENSSIRESFQVIADIFNINLKSVMLIFMVFITISIESMIYSTSGANFIPVEKKKISRHIKKDKKIGQLRMIV